MTKYININLFLILSIFSILFTGLFQINVYSQPIPSSTPISGTDLNYRNSWFANSFSGIDDKAVMHSIDAIAVDPATGSVYTNTFWEEGGMQISQFRNGQKIKHMRDTAGWGRSGGQAVAVNSQYVYGAISIGGGDACAESVVLNENGLLDNRLCGTNWITIARYKNTLIDGNAGDSEFAPFPTGYGRDESYLIINNQNDQTTTTCAISGAYATETELFIGDYCNDKVQVFDSETMTFKRDFSVPNPGKMTMDKQGNLWILSLKEEASNNTVGDFRYTYTDTEKILNYTSTGTKLTPELFGPEITNTRGLAVNSRNDLLVAIGGEPNKANAKQQIYFYNNIQTTPTYYKALGEENGYYGGAVKGEVRDGKFDWITGLAVDAQDNIYISMQKIGIVSYKEDGTKNWQVSGLLFLDSTANDPRNPNIYYSKWDKFEFDPNRPDGNNWKHLAKIYDFKQYPSDLRNWFAGEAFDALPIRVCYVSDTKFLVMSIYGGVVGYRFDKATQGEIAIPAFEIMPGTNLNSEVYLWTDLNGDGLAQSGEKVTESNDINYAHGIAVDEDCGVWIAQNGKKNVEDNITHYTPTALNAGGFSPNYSPANKTVYKTPNEVTSQEVFEPEYGTVGGTLKKLQYDKANDVMYISGFPDVNETNANTGDPRSVGSKLYRYNNWSNSSTRTLAWTVDIPQVFAGGTRNSTNLSLAGDYIAVSELIGDYGLFLFDKNTGQRSYLSSTVQGDYGLGWVDIPFGGVLLNYRPDGTYLATVEDDHYSKSFTYYFKPNSYDSVLTGDLYRDQNNNNTKDTDETGENLPAGTKLKLTSTTNSNLVFYPIINTGGDFSQSLPSGTYTIEYVLPSGYFINSSAPNSIVVASQVITDINPIGINTQTTQATRTLAPEDMENANLSCSANQKIVIDNSNLNFINNIPTTTCSGTLPAGVYIDSANPLTLKIGNVGQDNLSISNRLESSACTLSGNTFTCTNTPIGSLTGPQKIMFKIGNNQSFGSGYGIFSDSGYKVSIYSAESFEDGDIQFLKGLTGNSSAYNNILHRDWRTGVAGNEARIRLANFKTYTNMFPSGSNFVCNISVRPTGTSNAFTKLSHDSNNNGKIDPSETSPNVPYDTTSGQCTAIFTNQSFTGGQAITNSKAYNWEIKIEVLDTNQANTIVGTFNGFLGFKFAALIPGG